MLEHAIYSVISPEGAASILWRDTAQGAGRRDQHEDHSPDLVRFGVVDSIVPEPVGRRPSRSGGDHRRDRRGPRTLPLPG